MTSYFQKLRCFRIRDTVDKNFVKKAYEAVVPAGYISTYRYIQFEIKNRSITNVTTDTEDTSKIDTTADGIDFIITNTPGAALPNTGGPGTGALYLLGLMLTSLAGAGLMLRRRKSAHF